MPIHTLLGTPTSITFSMQCNTIPIPIPIPIPSFILILHMPTFILFITLFIAFTMWVRTLTSSLGPMFMQLCIILITATRTLVFHIISSPIHCFQIHLAYQI
eukprot:TRINITY_DN4952_c0_g1::TRINITY_DN4952_c0_g1_i1::g.16619::m.16619 TRINITY_DN4952_c0_g1::TRINITY_DN4952_c0_g1_i1::g.16619  ORF type:complete len:102 (-),score=13.35 TRINITY_DN4952_c0_g1_i1:183-488(-)